MAGYRADAAAVFERVRESVDYFIDFNRSLADQRTMTELIACYVLSTWFLDGFTVIGFLWPNGDPGCGKTQLLDLVTHVAYLGQLILAGGSYASLRDLANYGACLAFDDAENISDPWVQQQQVVKEPLEPYILREGAKSWYGDGKKGIIKW